VDGGFTCMMLVCRRLRALCSAPRFWESLQLTGPVRWLSACECASLTRRGVRQLVCGGAVSPHAVVATLLACGATLKSVTFELPASARWSSAMSDTIETLTHRCPQLTSLHFTPAPVDDPVPTQWCLSAVLALCTLLRTGRVKSLSLTEVAAPPAALAALGDAAGDSLRTLLFFPDTAAQLNAARRGAAGLSGLRLLCTSWHVIPRVLPAFLAASTGLVRLELHWLRDFRLPQGIDTARLAALLSADGLQALAAMQHAHGLAALQLLDDDEEEDDDGMPAFPPGFAAPPGFAGLPPGFVAPALPPGFAAPQLPPGFAAPQLPPGFAAPPPQQNEAAYLAAAAPFPGELDACLLALANVARAVAAAADAPAFAADAVAAIAAARPLSLMCLGPESLSAEGIAAAVKVYPPLTLASPHSDDDEDDDYLNG
jgi:hypothetical protein